LSAKGHMLYSIFRLLQRRAQLLFNEVHGHLRCQSKDGAVAQYPLLFKLHLLFMETNACMALFITAFYWGLVSARASQARPGRPPLHPG